MKTTNKPASVTKFRIVIFALLIVALAIVSSACASNSDPTPTSTLEDKHIPSWLMPQPDQEAASTTPATRTVAEVFASGYNWITRPQAEMLAEKAEWCNVGESPSGRSYFYFDASHLTENPLAFSEIFGEELVSAWIEMSTENWGKDGDEKIFLSQVSVHQNNSINLSFTRIGPDGISLWGHTSIYYCYLANSSAINVTFFDLGSTYRYEKKVQLELGSSDRGFATFAKMLKLNPEFWVTLRQGESGQFNLPE